MARKYVRIGSLSNVHLYDDGDFDGGVETDDVIKAHAAPVDGEDVLRKDDIDTLVSGILGPAASTDNAIARWDGVTGKKLDTSLAYVDDSGNITGEDITANEVIFIKNIKSGATQAAAGAAADELWKTSGHASLPDNVIMIGV